MRYEKRFAANWPQRLYERLEELSAETEWSKSELLAALFADEVEAGEAHRLQRLLDDYQEKFERLVIDGIENERQGELLRAMFRTFHKTVTDQVATYVGKNRGNAIRRILERLENDDPTVGERPDKKEGGEGVGGTGSNDAEELTGVFDRD